MAEGALLLLGRICQDAHPGLARVSGVEPRVPPDARRGGNADDQRGARQRRRVRVGATSLGVAEPTPDRESAPGRMGPRLARRTLFGSLPALVGISYTSLASAAVASMHASFMPSGFPHSVHAVFGFGAVGAAAAETAAAAAP